MKSSKIIFLLLLLLSCTGVWTQSVTWTTDATQACDQATSQDPTSVTTFNGSIYYIYVNVLRQMIVVKKTGSLVEKSIVFDLEMGLDEIWHVCPTIGVDRKGYIHICGDMHNDSWKYFRSNNPEDISSWTRRTDLPGKGITYPTIFSDNNKDLYICFRQQGADGTGNHRGGIIQYNADNETFNMLGGTTYSDGTNVVKTLVWGNGFGADGCWYTKPGIRIFFDGNNRMHLAASLYNVCVAKPQLVYGNHTHIIYAYSDDKGQTWHKAGGSLITTLPLTVSNASIVINRTTNHDIVGGSIELGAFNTNKPVLIYQKLNDDGRTTTTWNGTAWVNLTLPHISMKTLVSRPNGYTACYNGIHLDYSLDGITWKTLTGVTAFPGGTFGEMGGVDREYFKQTGNFRYHGKFNDYTESSIFTINSNIGNEISAVETPKYLEIKAFGFYDLFTLQGAFIGLFDVENLNPHMLKQNGINSGFYLAVPNGELQMRKVFRILVL